MARDIKTRLSLDGEQQFKQGLKSVDSELRVMQSQLKALTSGYTGNAKSAEALAKQHDLLKERVTLSQNKVKALEGAVADSSQAYEKASAKAKEMAEAYGENSAEAIAAANAASKAEAAMDGYRIKLANAQTQLGKNTAELKNFEKELDAAKPATKFEQAAASVKKLGEALAPAIKKAGEMAATAGKISFKAAEASVKAFSETTKAALNAGIQAVTAYTAAITGLGTALFAVTKTAAVAADDINTLSKQTGISTAELQKMAYAADLIDVNVETITGSMTKLIKNMNAAQKGTGSAAEAFSTLGVAVTNADGSLRSNQDVFADTIKALGTIENETERDALAMTVLGKSAQELNPLILGGADALEQLGSSAESLGLILDQQALDKLNAFNDSLDTLKANAEASGNVIALKFADKFRAVTDILGQNVPTVATALAGVFDGRGVSAAGFTDALTDVGSQLSQKISGLAPSVLKGMNNLFVAIGDAANKLLPDAVQNGGKILQNSIGGLVRDLSRRLPDYAATLASGAEELFGGLLTGLNDTAERLNGVIPKTLDRISGTITDGIPRMLDSALDLFGTIVSGLGAAVDKLLPMIPPMVAKIGASVKEHLPELLNTVVSVVANAAQFVAENLSDVVSGAGEIIGVITDNLLSGGNLDKLIDAALELISAAGNAVLTNLPKLFTGAGNLIGQIGSFLSRNLPKVISTAVSIVGSLLREVPAKLLPALLQVLPKLQKVVQELLPAILDSLSEQLPLIYSAAADLLTYTAEAMKEQLPSVTKMLAENISTALPVLYESLAGVVMALSQVFSDQEVMNALISTIPVLAQAVADSISAYAPIYADMVVKLGKTVIKSIPTLVPALLNVLAALSLPLVQWLASVIRDSRDTIRTALENLLTRMERGAKEAIRGFFEFFSTLPEKLAYYLGLALRKAVDFVTDFPGKAKEAAESFVDKLKESIKNLPEKIDETLQSVLSTVGRWKDDLGNKAKESAENMKNKIKEAVDELPGKLENVGKDIVEGLWKGINNKGDWLREKLSTYCHNIVDAFKRGFDINSPSRKMRDTVGNNLALGIAEGFTATMRRVTDQMIGSIPTDLLVPQGLELAGSSYAMAAANYAPSDARPGSGNVYNINISVENARIDSSQNIRDTAELLADETQKALAGKGKW